MENVNVTGAPPKPREGAAFVNVNNLNILLHGGFSGKSGTLPPKNEARSSMAMPGEVPHPWLPDLHVLRVTASKEDGVACAWTQVIAGPGSPSPRCGHRMLVVDMAETDPYKSKLHGSGLIECEVGENTHFFMDTFDRVGSPRWCGRITCRSSLKVLGRVAFCQHRKKMRRRLQGILCSTY